MLDSPTPSTPWRFAAAVQAVRVDDDIVVLDVIQDRYLCLPGAGPEVDVDDAGIVRTILNADLGAALAQAGLAAQAPKPLVTSWSPLAPPRYTALPDRLERVRATDLAPMLHAMQDLALAYWRRPLADLLRTAGADRAEGDDTASADLLKVTARFHRWAPYAPTSSKCLLRSFMLLRLLQRHGLHARWVFGVRTWPFEAHCWLQGGDVVLDDDVERVAALTPILVVG